MEFQTDIAEQTGLCVSKEPEIHIDHVNEEGDCIYTESDSSELIDKIVTTEDEAYNLYNNYAFNCGFGIKRDTTKYKPGTKILRSKEYRCCMAGKKNLKKAQDRLFKKLDVRTNCPAMIRFTVEEADRWVLTAHLMVHNHPFVSSDQIHLLRSHRKVKEYQLEYLSQMKDNGIQVSKAYQLLSEASGGKNKVGFTRKDAYDALDKKKVQGFHGTDANTLLKILKERKDAELDFYYDFCVDDESRLCSIFWRDGRMCDDYKFFGDLLVHDTTYRTNKYNMICAPFIGMNNHGLNIMFGCGFLINEKTESFIWLFETFLKSMNGISPQTIMTDQCSAIAAAIERVFPSSVHRLCVWHLMENAKKKIKSLYHNKNGFHDQFQHILKNCESVAEFNTLWPRFLDTHNCHDNDWLKRLFNNRTKWCRAFTKDYFSGGVLSSQRSESTNHSISRNLTKTSTLCQFYTTFCKVISDWRDNEKEEDLRCFRGKVDLAAVDVKILSEARNVYTNKIYQLFEVEFMKSWACHHELLEQEHTTITYSVWKPKEDIFRHSVKFHTETSHVQCTCKLLTEVGILCAHCLRIMNFHCVDKLEDIYILKRWRKNIPGRRNKQGSDVASTSKSWGTDQLTQTNWMMLMAKMANEIILASAPTETTRDLCLQAFRNLKDEVSAQPSGTPFVDGVNAQPGGTPTVQNPRGSRTKGQRNDRWKSATEKIYKKRSRNKNRSNLVKEATVQSFKSIDKDAQEQGVFYAHPANGGDSLTTIVPDLQK